jgi:hypothetical protein
MTDCGLGVPLHAQGPAIGQLEKSAVFLGPRANAKLEHKFHVALHTSHAALSMLTSKFYPDVDLPILTEILFECRRLKEIGEWLRAGRPRGPSSNRGKVKNFLFSTSSTPALGSTQWIRGGGSFPGSKAVGA